MPEYCVLESTFVHYWWECKMLQTLSKILWQFFYSYAQPGTSAPCRLTGLIRLWYQLWHPGERTRMPRVSGISPGIILGGHHFPTLHLGFLGLLHQGPCGDFPSSPSGLQLLWPKGKSPVWNHIFLRSNSRHVKYPFHTTPVAPWRLTVWGKVPVRPRLEPLDTPPRGFLFSLTVSTVWNYMVLWVFASSSLPTGLQSSWAELSWSCSGCGPSSGLEAWLTEILTSSLLSV